MALESIGLKATLSFDSTAAVQSMGNASRSFASLREKALETGQGIDKLTWATLGPLEKQAYRVKSAVSDFKSSMTGFKDSLPGAMSGVAGLGMALTPVTLAMGGGVVAAGSYERSLSNLRATMGDVNDQDFKQITDKTRELGISSVYSATQSTEAMRELSTLGFDQKQMLAAIGPVLNAASVAQVDLATAAGIVGGTTRAMALDIGQAASVADKLTVAAEKSASTLPSLAEGFAYGSAGALKWGMGMDETAAILGKLSDRMFQGSTGGMILMNVVNSLVSPTNEAKKALANLHVNIAKADKTGFRPMIEVITEINEKLKAVPDVAKRAEIESTIFAERAGKGFRALADTGTEAVQTLQKQIAESMGAAERSSKIRLDNMYGAWVLFRSSLESLSINMFDPLLKWGKKALNGVTENLNNVLYAMGELSDESKKGHDEWSAYHFVSVKYGKNQTAVAMGLNAAMTNVTNTIQGLGSAFGLMSKKGDEAFGVDKKAKLTEYVSTFFMLAAAVAPIGLSVWGIGKAVGSLMDIMKPLGFLASGAGAALRYAFFTSVGDIIGRMRLFIFYLRTDLFMALASINRTALTTALRFGAITLAVVGIIIAIYLLITHWETVKATMEDMGNALYDLLHPEQAKTRKQSTIVSYKPVDSSTLSETIGSSISKQVQEVAGKLGGTSQAADDTKAAADAARDAAQAAAEAAKAAADAAKKQPPIKLNLDGREIARNTSKHDEEIEIRSGDKLTPWQRNRIVVHGARAL